ncbi:glycosyltransferase [Clostridium felsineum]|uniref:Uncharacterized protein n=1 Tax=Clostridium felsineum TaxID=36839 RepID=A0A1S8MD93_9CLOT|nr:hypothetical protein [Clostridium felsineum]URZ06305.1 hypothetical protein CLROS_016380 [Clostridium felsineum]URZ11340.1 hypothetical protein CROST_020570 [Clostridium felsineum]
MNQVKKNSIVKNKEVIKNPKVSIILYVDNECDMVSLKSSMESVLNQEFKEFELIVVGDYLGKTLENLIINYIHVDNRVIYMKNIKKSESPALIINQGLDIIRGKYIAYQSQYGYWGKDALQFMYNKISCIPNESLVYAKIKIVNDKKYGDIEIGQDFRYDELLDRNFIVSNSIIHNSSIIKKFGGFNTNISIKMFYEWETWIRWSSKIQFIFVNKIIGGIKNYNIQLFTNDLSMKELNIFRSSILKARTEGTNKYSFDIDRKITILVIKVFFDPTLDVTVTNFMNLLSDQYNMIYISSHQLNEEILDMVDIVILHRTYDRAASEFLNLAKHKNKPVIYWLDDDLLNVHKFITGFLIPDTTQFDELVYQIKNADLIVSASSQISRSVTKYNANIRELKITILKKYIKEDFSQNNDSFKIAYIGNPRKSEMDLIWDDLISISNQYRGKVEFYFWGYIPERIKEIKASRVYTEKYTMSYYEYLNRLKKEKFNLIIAPLFESEFNNGKSPTKYLEACVCGAVGLYSDVSTYDGVIDGVNGFKVKNEKYAWNDKIQKIIEMDSCELKLIYNNAVKNVIEEHSTESQLHIFEDIMFKLRSSKVEPDTAADYKDKPVNFREWNIFSGLDVLINSFSVYERILFEKYYFEIKFALKKVKSYKKLMNQPISYFIWGASDLGIIMEKIISIVFPNLKLIGFLDKFKMGLFRGINIYNVNELLNYKFEYIFIATSRGRCEVEKELMKLKFQKYKNFVSIIY